MKELAIYRCGRDDTSNTIQLIAWALSLGIIIGSTLSDCRHNKRDAKARIERELVEPYVPGMEP